MIRIIVEKKKLESLEIDIKKRIFKLNGKEMKGISRLDIDYDNGSWTLFVTKDVVYSQAVSDEIT